MKLEMDENSSLTVGIVALFVLVAVVAIGGCSITEETQRQAIKAGMVYKPSQTTNGGWVKP